MNKVTTSRPASVSSGRGEYAALHWPDALHRATLGIYAEIPDIVIAPWPSGRRRLIVLDLLDFLLAERAGDDLMDVIATFLMQERVDNFDELEDQALAVESTCLLIKDITAPYFDLLPDGRWRVYPIVAERLLLVRL